MTVNETVLAIEAWQDEIFAEEDDPISRIVASMFERAAPTVPVENYLSAARWSPDIGWDYPDQDDDFAWGPVE